MPWDGKEQRYNGEDRRIEQWHLKKEVPIATILTVIFAMGTGSIWLSAMRSDIDMHWQAFQQHIETEADRLSMTRSQNTLVLRELKEIRKDIVTIKVTVAKNIK